MDIRLTNKRCLVGELFPFLFWRQFFHSGSWEHLSSGGIHSHCENGWLLNEFKVIPTHPFILNHCLGKLIVVNEVIHIKWFTHTVIHTHPFTIQSFPQNQPWQELNPWLLAQILNSSNTCTAEATNYVLVRVYNWLDNSQSWLKKANWSAGQHCWWEPALHRTTIFGRYT